MPTEHVGFLQVKHIHLVASCSTIFSMFEGDLSWRKGIGLCTLCIRWRINIWLLNILPSNFETTLLLDAVFIGFLWYKCSERTMWLHKNQLLVHCPLSLLC